MALSLNQVKKTNSSSRPKAHFESSTSSEAPPEVKKVRPWQQPQEEAPVLTSPSEPAAETFEWLEAAEALKKKGLSQLPTEVREVIENSWLGKVQLAPKIRIPIPSIFVTKERP